MAGLFLANTLAGEAPRVPGGAPLGVGAVGRPADIFLAMPTWISRPFVWALLAAYLGCDLGEYVRPAPSAECLEAGALCELESGPLGVCESRRCRSSETPPCFMCTPQH